MDSLPPTVRRYWPLALTAVGFALYGWAMVVATGSGHDGVIGPHFNALGADWAIFMAAGRAIFSHDVSHIYDQLWIAQAVNSEYANWLSAPEPHPLFPYPPVYLLVVVPFALLPIGWSLLASQILQFAALAGALMTFVRGRFLAIAALMAPAASNNVLAGSNALLVAALIVGGLAALDTSPLLAGALLGLVIFKPQFVPLLLVALIAGRHWRALAAMGVTSALFVLASVIAFGPNLWLKWADVYIHPQAVDGVNGTEWGHIWDDSVSTCVSLLGAPREVAIAVQMAAALFAAVSVWQVFAARHPARTAILLCAGLLASPHISNYDLIGVAIAAAALTAQLPANTRPLLLVLPLMAYAAPLFDPPRVVALGLITPLLILGVMVALWRNPADPRASQAGTRAPRET